MAVGLLRYACNLQRREVRRELERRGILLSEGEISRLSDEFLVRFHNWFNQTRSRWGPRLQRGLVLLIDGTQDAGGPVTYRAITYAQGVTVHAATLASENEEDVAAFLETIKKEVGVPRLIVRDGSSAAKNACTRVLPGVPQALCHWHFLRNVGEALLGKAYAQLRKLVVDTKQLARLEDVRGKLANEPAGVKGPERRVLRVWARLSVEEVLSARDSVGGFPFRVAYHDVMTRVRRAREEIQQAIKLSLAWNAHEPLLTEARERLDALGDHAAVGTAFLRVDRRLAWFSQLRTWLRLEEASTGRPHEPPGDPLDEGEVAKRVYALREEARSTGIDEEEACMDVIARFEEHRHELFPRVRVKRVPRTTARIENAHRESRRTSRRRKGTLSTSREMERIGDHLAVVSNLHNPWFARHALAGVDLIEAFRTQDMEEVKAALAQLKAKRYQDRLPIAAKARRSLLTDFAALAQDEAPLTAFTQWADRVEGAA